MRLAVAGESTILVGDHEHSVALVSAPVSSSLATPGAGRHGRHGTGPHTSNHVVHGALGRAKDFDPGLAQRSGGSPANVGTHHGLDVVGSQYVQVMTLVGSIVALRIPYHTYDSRLEIDDREERRCAEMGELIGVQPALRFSRYANPHGRF
jgi:hypothetical protein